MIKLLLISSMIFLGCKSTDITIITPLNRSIDSMFSENKIIESYLNNGYNHVNTHIIDDSMLLIVIKK
jgi:hypothetical protein